MGVFLGVSASGGVGREMHKGMLAPSGPGFVQNPARGIFKGV